MLRRILPITLPLLLSLAPLARSAGQVAAAAAPPTLPSAAELEPGWNTLRPGGETSCAHGDEYVFYARLADPGRLLVFLYGGGGCWDGESCDPERPNRETYASVIEPGSHPSRVGGILNLQHPQNPFADYSIVAVPVCTGDTHLGARDATYTRTTDSGEVRRFTIRHRGQTNAMTAVRWIESNFPGPREIFVAGTSAGAVGTPFYASLLARRYPAARVVGLGDDAGGLGGDATPGSDPTEWGVPEVLRRHAGWEGVEPPYGTRQLYTTAARSAPNLTLYQVDHAHDATQRFYMEMARGADLDVAGHIRRNRQAIAEQVPGFRWFMLGGSSHGILPFDLLYPSHSAGTPLREWIAAIRDGRPVESVDCGECLHPGFLYTPQDLRVVERMMELLSPEGAWNPLDGPGPCPQSAERYTLRCAAVAATREVTGAPPGGSNVPAAIWDLVLAAGQRLGTNRGEPLRPFNNRPGTTAADVLGLVGEVRDRIRLALAAN